MDAAFFAYSWKLPAYSGAFVLTVDNFSFFTYNWSFSAYSFSFFAYSGKVRLIRALRDCKQRSLTVSKKAPTVSKKASPLKYAFLQETKISPPTPSSHGRPPIRVKDVRAKKTSFSCAPSDGVKAFGLRRPPGYPPRRPWEIPFKNFMLWAAFPLLIIWKLMHRCPNTVSTVLFQERERENSLSSAVTLRVLRKTR